MSNRMDPKSLKLFLRLEHMTEERLAIKTSES